VDLRRGRVEHHRGVSAPAAGVWSQVVGQPAAVAELQAAAAHAAQVRFGGGAGPQVAGAMTHAWLIPGPPGSGRSVAARAFAAALECPDQGCGHCPACHTVLSGTHADVREIVPEGLSIAVREMLALVEIAARMPSTARWQIVIIEDADRLTEGASNALLKAVEEPSERTVFLLCAPSEHPDDVSITIRSRCRPLRLRTPSADAIARVLIERDGVAESDAAWAASVCGGHIGRARRLARDADARQRRGFCVAAFLLPRRSAHFHRAQYIWAAPIRWLLYLAAHDPKTSAPAAAALAAQLPRRR
jgi:DNA polymerase-3 subunit delta'